MAIAASFNHLGMLRVFLTISSSCFVIRQIHNGYAVNNDSADCQTNSYNYEQLHPGDFLLQIFAAVAPEAGDGEDIEDAA